MSTCLPAQSSDTKRDFHPPGDRRYAQITATGTILPGGRILQPLGIQLESGPGTVGVAVSPKGNVATSDTGPERYGVTLMTQAKNLWSVRHYWARTPNSHLPEAADPFWKGVASGIAFDSEKAVWVSEGDSGKIRLLDLKSGSHEKLIDLNQGEWKNSFTGELALDSARRLLYVVDQGNDRVVVLDAKKGQVLSSVGMARKHPHQAGKTITSIGLSPEGTRVYITDTDGALGAIEVPRSGWPSGVEPFLVRWMDPVAGGRQTASDLLAVGDLIYVSDASNDTIRVISATEHRELAAIPLRVPGLQELRGVRPAGLAFDPVTKWLLVAEAGMNAMGVLDTGTNELLGHIPVGWEPRRVAIWGDRVFVTNSEGRGTGPSLRRPLLEFGEAPSLRRGTVSTFIMPGAGDLPKLTRTVLAANGMLADAVGNRQPGLPQSIQHVVLIVKDGHSFDEVLGDVSEANHPLNRRVQAIPQLARFGLHGLADGQRQQLSVKDVAVTPNQHAATQRWAFSDNFYAGDGSANSDSELWSHLQRHGLTFRKFETGADGFIAAMEITANAGNRLPAFLLVRLPTGTEHDEGQSDAYPFPASHVADDDLAVGRILEYLSHTPWWPGMVVFVTDETAGNGMDHIDSHRTPLLAAGPHIRQNYVTHTNSDGPGLLKTIFGVLHIPPMGLRDATAGTLYDIFTAEPDYAPFDALPSDKRVFDPTPGRH